MADQGRASAPTRVPKPRAQRQIRALHDSETITLYQAYPEVIARPALEAQNLRASPAFKLTRMTWVKPSFCWMMYRSGYGRKDPGQAVILALQIRHASFLHLLSLAVPSSSVESLAGDRPVRVQWDPERNPATERIPDVRSLQLGIPPSLIKDFADSYVVRITDVTHQAHALERELKENLGLGSDIGGCVDKGLVPREETYHVSGNLKEQLEMD